MSGRGLISIDELVADHVRSMMRVDPPPSFREEVMRAVAAMPQGRANRFAAFGAFGPAIAVAAATAVIMVVGLFLFAPRAVGPSPQPSVQPTATPAPTITPDAARIVAEPGDSIRIPALDEEGAFGSITIERGDERGGYEGFLPVAFGDVFFVELYVTYEPERATSEQYGEWEFAYAVDVDGDGFDGDDRLERGVGFLGMEEMPGYESAPQPLLGGMRSGDDVLEGWLVLELPAAAAEWDVYLVYGHGEWSNGIENMAPDASALLRTPGEPVGVSTFDPDAFPTPDPAEGTPFAMPSLHALPTPMPSPASTFEPVTDEEADTLFAETQECVNSVAAVTVTFPASWYTNEAVPDFPACSLFGPEPIDPEVLASRLADLPPVLVRHLPSWSGGIEQPIVARFPLGDRIAWRISFSEDQLSFGTNYLIPTTDDPYGPFVHAVALEAEYIPVVERILARLELEE